MATVPDTGRIIYFGKVPSRGDFVKSRSGSRVLDMLDAWVTQGLERLSADPGWKVQYDNAPPTDFAFLATSKPLLLVGQLKPSADASQRRFPFIAAVASSSDSPLRMVARSPLCLANTWQIIHRMVAAVLAADDPMDSLEAMSGPHVSPADGLPAAERVFADFLANTSIAQVEDELRQSGHTVSLRRKVLSLGLLLSPLLAAGAHPDKGLCLPLPARPDMAAKVGALWMELISAFLSRREFELGLFIQPQKARPVLALAFNGANAAALCAMFDSQEANGYLIDMCAADWVEDYVKNDYAITKLSSYLEMPGLSIRQAIDTFKEAFLGA